MHLANQSPRKQTSYPRVQWGNTLDKREATDPRKNESREPREAEQRGMLGQGTIKNIGLPILQEARN